MDWKEAVEEAREELGYSPNQYVRDWDEIVETAKEIRHQWIEEYQDEYKIEKESNKQEYRDRLNTPYWQELRERRLKIDNYTCKDCKGQAAQVHHNRYVNMNTAWEIYELVSLCESCHKKRHKMKDWRVNVNT